MSNQNKARLRRKFDNFATEYDRWDATHRSVDRRRAGLLHPLRGRVLEVGVGTGLNLPLYRKTADVTACDISGRMLKRAAARLSGLNHRRIKLVRMDAQKLLFLPDTFDAVVGTFLFCSVNRPGKVAREIKRVLRPGGRFVTLGYHSGRVARLLRRAGLKIIASREWPPEKDGRAVGRIVAAKTA